MRNLRDEARWIIGEIDEAKRLAKAVGKPQLGTSSIEAGRVEEYDQDGALVQIIGEQYDGTHAPVTVNGPTPPEPAGLSLTVGVGSVEARWNGKFAGDAVSPMDFSHVSLHGSRPEVFTPSNETQLATIAGELGDVATVILEPGEWTFGLVAVSKAGKWSELSETVTVEIPDYPAPVDIQDELILLDEKYDGVITEAGNIGNRLDQAEQDLTAHEGRLEQAETDVNTALSGDVDIDRLAIGNGVIRDLVAQHIAGQTAAFQQVDVKNLFVTTGTMTEAVINRLFADVVMSRKITAQMLAVGSFDNIFSEPDFTDNGSSWSNRAAFPVVAGAGEGGNQAVVHALDATNKDMYNLPLRRSLEPGANYRVRARVWSSTPIPVGGFWSLNQSFTVANVSSWVRAELSAIVPAQTWTWVDFQIQIPPSSHVINLGFSSRSNHSTGELRIDRVSATRMAGGELVVDGSIKARHADLGDFAANTGFIADLTARIVKADMFVGKEFQGGVFTGSVFQSPPGGAGFQLTENGYTSRDADGNVTVRLPADGTPAQFRGDVEAKSLTASGRVSMQAEGNEIASGADLVLEAGVTPPLTPPTVGTAYATVPLPAAAQGETAAGLTYADGLWWRTVDAAGTDAGDRLEGFDGNGALVRSFPVGVGTTINGLAALGSEIYILGVKHGQPASTRHVLVYGVDGKFKREWAYTDYGSGTYQPGIGVNGSNLIIGQPRYTGMLTWRTFNPTNGTLINTVDTAYRRNDHVVGIVQTAGDFGTSRVVVSYAGGATETFTTTGDKTTAAESFFSAGKNPVRGLVWQGGYFWQYTQQYGIVRLSGIKDPTGNAGGDTDDWWIAATWTGPNGTETTMGQPQRFVFYRRSELQLSAGTPPAGVTGTKFYLARKLFAPTRSDMHLVATFTGASGRLATLPTNWGTSPSPPATNTFATASPAIIRSRSNNFKVDGAGAGKWGPLVFHADGTMTSNAVPSWVPITSFLNGCTVGDFGFVPAYRSWPDGKVELRGVVKGNLDVIKTIFSLPSAVRSAQPVNMVAATSGGGNSPAVMRVEIGSLATPDAMSVNPQGVTRSWVSLDGLYYYQV